MKKNLYFVILMLVPMLAIGQDDFQEMNVMDGYITNRNLSKALVSKPSNIFEVNTSTTLINDIRNSKIRYSLNLDSPPNLSLTTRSHKRLYVIDEQLTERMLSEVGTLINFNDRPKNSN